MLSEQVMFAGDGLSRHEGIEIGSDTSHMAIAARGPSDPRQCSQWPRSLGLAFPCLLQGPSGRGGSPRLRVRRRDTNSAFHRPVRSSSSAHRHRRPAIMALQEVTNSFLRRLRTTQAPAHRSWTTQCRRYASEGFGGGDEMEETSFQSSAGPSQRHYDPVALAKKRNKQLPPSR